MDNSVFGDRPQESMNAGLEASASSNALRAEAQNAQTGQHREAAATAAAVLPPILLEEAGLPKAEGQTDLRTVIVVDKSEHRTHLLQMQNNKVEEVLSVPDATGRGPRMTPEGRFEVTEKVRHPSWYPPADIGGSPVGPGPHNPLGPAKIRTSADGGLILLHGTNRPDQIGTNASHGCIRHFNSDILKIFPLVERGDAVYIVKHFNGTAVRPGDFGSRS